MASAYGKLPVYGNRGEGLGGMGCQRTASYTTKQEIYISRTGKAPTRMRLRFPVLETIPNLWDVYVGVPAGNLDAGRKGIAES